MPERIRYVENGLLNSLMLHDLQMNGKFTCMVHTGLVTFYSRTFHGHLTIFNESISTVTPKKQFQ